MVKVGEELQVVVVEVEEVVVWLVWGHEKLEPVVGELWGRGMVEK